MKVKAKAPFFDERGLHRKGDIVDVRVFRPELMEMVEEKKAEEIKESIDETPAPTPEKAVKRPRKTTRKKA